MDADQMSKAVERCLADARRSERPFRTVNEFLAALKLQGWDEAARAEVQSQVLAAMKRRRAEEG
jgi:hypothetical protein